MLSPFVSAEADPVGEYSRLDGLTTAIMVISCTFLGLSLIAISLRTYVRLSRSLFRLDDGFMIAGAVSYFLHRRWDRSISLASICSFQVPGILHCSYLFDNKSPPRGYWKTRQAPRCVALKRGDKVLHHLDPHVCDRARDSQVLDLHDDFLRHRDTAQAAHRHICATSYDMGVLLYNLRRQGECAPISTFVILGHVATVSTIVTDFGLVVVPAIILWDTHMKRKRKLQALGLLSFASV